MMVPEIITSGQNPKIKALLELQEKSRARREKGLFVVEGQRELDHCIAAGFVPVTLGTSRLRTETAALAAIAFLNLYSN